ncbi:hypothetical protein [Dysgonomonas gadei]|uniref:Uncharacterized protein n=1 Tax=Dysgonomonas gadei ATCC BAA-286 TaxID=742766 RepID=F5J382_9BACT|nr:hypothetical protein [Dysgonomonas gadei]EGJ99926.1 hypothetical protein HMPREF9455_03799 [Dysgonomonas gadei ATCC BAA-286]
MKKLIIAISILFAVGVFNPLSAQVNINVNINVDKQPAWGPTGYDYAGYYYMPDINVYYDITNALFYYLTGSKWISAQYLPDKYRKYDLYSMYKVVVNDKQPWLQNKTHKKNYSQYKGDKTQEPIRYSNNAKYNTSKNNTNSWVNTNRSDSRSGNTDSNRTDSRSNNNGNNKTQDNNSQRSPERTSQQNGNNRR